MYFPSCSRTYTPSNLGFEVSAGSFNEGFEARQGVERQFTKNVRKHLTGLVPCRLGPLAHTEAASKVTKQAHLEVHGYVQVGL